MNVEKISGPVKQGMFVGSHGSKHYWLDRISKEAQEKDIVSSLEFLEEVGANVNDWIMCYPYGAYNENTLSLLKKYNAIAGVTTEVRSANIGVDDLLTLPRWDTNDFPQ